MRKNALFESELSQKFADHKTDFLRNPKVYAHSHLNTMVENF